MPNIVIVNNFWKSFRELRLQFTSKLMITIISTIIYKKPNG